MNNPVYKRLLTAGAIVCCALALVAYQLSQFAIDTSLGHWHNGSDGYNKALLQQKQSGKAVALFFHTDWCSSCKNLRETVLSSSQFDNFSKNLIPVKINPEKSLANKQIADKYRVIGYPTFLIITADHQSITPVRTGLNMPPEKFIASCKKALKT